MTDMTPTLPPLQNPLKRMPEGLQEEVRAYATAYGEQCARAAVEAYKAEKGHVTLTRVEGRLVAVTRQDDEGRILSIIWEADQDKPTTPPAVETRMPDGWNPAQGMTAHRAIYFMERFKKEEKLLGPNEQAAVDFVIAMLSAAPAAPGPQAVAEPVATLLDFDTHIQIGTVDLHGNWRDLRVGDKLFATQPPTQQASEPQYPEGCGGLSEYGMTVDSWYDDDDEQTSEVTCSACKGLGYVPAPQQASAQGEQAQQASAQPTQAAKDVLPEGE